MRINLTVLLTLLILSPIKAQTNLIAYKSHSGNMKTYELSGFDNLGNPPMDFEFYHPLFVDTIFKLNDSTIIKNTKDWHVYDSLSVCYKDTISKTKSSMWFGFKPLDSIPSSLKNEGIVFVGFDSISNNKIDTVSANKEEENINVIPTTKEDAAPPTHTKQTVNNLSSKLYLLWYGLFGFVALFSITIWFKFKPKLQV